MFIAASCFFAPHMASAAKKKADQPAVDSGRRITATTIVAGSMSWGIWSAMITLSSVPHRGDYTRSIVWNVSLGLHMTTIALSSLAGHFRGMHDANMTADPLSTKRRPIRFIAVGATTLSVGLATCIGLRLNNWVGLGGSLGPHAYLTISQFGGASIAAGTGFLVYGMTLQAKSNKTVLPWFGPELAGMSASWRF